MEKKRLVLDGAALVLYALAALPAFTGIAAHEWLSLAAIAVLLAHCVAGLGGVAGGGLLRRSPSWTAHLALDGLILVVLAVCATSGIMVSGAALPALGLHATGYFFWDPLHAVSAKALLALLLVHVALHAGWVAASVRREGRVRRERGRREGP